MIGDQVSDAFDLLLDELGLVSGELRRQVADLATTAELEEIETIIHDAKSIERVTEAVQQAAKQWRGAESVLSERYEPDPEELVQTSEAGESVRKRYFGRVPKGRKTSEPAFRRPILEILAERGGAAKIGEVLDEVERRMGAGFTDTDYETLPSDDKTIRWRNTAQWSRNQLVQYGLMERPRRRGIWEISDAGRQFLEGGGNP